MAHCTCISSHHFLLFLSIQPQFKYILKHRANQMTPSQMCCTKHNICNEKTDPIDFTIENDREPVFKVNQTVRSCLNWALLTKLFRYSQAPKEYNFDESAVNSSGMITILHLTDFRYDPQYAPGSSSTCMESACCRNSSTVSAQIKTFRQSTKLILSANYNKICSQNPNRHTKKKIMVGLTRTQLDIGVTIINAIRPDI